MEAPEENRTKNHQESQSQLTKKQEEAEKENEAKKLQESLLMIREGVKAGISHIKETKKSVLVLGNTGEGKSTWVNYIAGNPLVASNKTILCRKKLILNASKPLGQIQIGHTSVSKTKIAHPWIDPTNGIAYWDCPGFDDTRGFEQDMINGFCIHNIIQNSVQVKFVIVVSQETLTATRENKFIEVIKKLTDLFKDISPIKESIGFAWTKVTCTQAKPNDLKEYLKEQVLPHHKQRIGQKEKELIQCFSNQKSKIFIFSAPQGVGKFEMSISQQEKEMLSSLKFVEKPNTKIAVDPKYSGVLEKCAKNVNEVIGEQCKRINDALQDQIERTIRDENSFKALKETLAKIKESVQKIKDSKNYRQFLSNHHQLVKNYKLDESFQQKLQSLLDILNFIGLVKPGIEHNLLSWKENIQINKLLENSIADPQVKLLEDKTLTVAAPLIDISTIQATIKQRNQIKSVNVLVWDTIYVDSDLSLPGVNISILAKNWKVTGQRKISLKGQDAQNHEKRQQTLGTQNDSGRGVNGADGLSGKAGQTGGSFFGKLMPGGKITGQGKLSIDVRGGNGGDGQEGGHGGNGRDGQHGQEINEKEPQPKFIFSREEYTFSKKNGFQKFNQFWKTIATFNGQMLEVYRSVGEKGQFGGDPGKGGAAGKGGASGCCKLVDITADKIEGDGEQGRNGRYGKIGQGGKHGNTFEGEYINQTVFTGIREARKKIQAKKLMNETQAGVLPIIGSGITSVMALPVGMVVGQQIALQTIEQTAKQLFKKAVQQAAKQLGKKAAQQAAKQLGKKAAQQAAKQLGTKALIAGGISFGASLAVQGTLSAISASVSSGWKKKPQRINGGRALSGRIPNELNVSGREEPARKFEPADEDIQKLQSEYREWQSK